MPMNTDEEQQEKIAVKQAVEAAIHQAAGAGSVSAADVQAYFDGTEAAARLLGHELWSYLTQEFGPRLRKHQQLGAELKEHQSQQDHNLHLKNVKGERDRIVLSRQELTVWLRTQTVEVERLFGQHGLGKEGISDI